MDKVINFFSVFLLVWLIATPALGEQKKDLLAATSPLFIQNKGQIKATDGKGGNEILFKAELGATTVYFRPNGISYVLKYSLKSAANEEGTDELQLPGKNEGNLLRLHRVDVKFLNADPLVAVYGEEKTSSYFNYYGEPNSDGILHVPAFKRIIYPNIYPNIDLVFYFSDKDGHIGLKYDFVVRPGGEYGKIQMQYEGAEKLFIDEAGRLVSKTPLGDLIEDAPVSFQENEVLPGKFVLGEQLVEGKAVVSFKIENHTPGKEMVIDPYVRSWATLLGGSTGDEGKAVAVDSLDNAYIVGTTGGNGFPVTTGAFQTTSYGGDGFISKFDSSGNLVWSTYYRDALFNDIAIYNSSELFICGQGLDSFPTSPNAWQPQLAPSGTISSNTRDAVLLKFDTSGTRKWATFIGGDLGDNFTGIAVSTTGSVYAAGRTGSSNFPVTAGAYMSTFSEGVAVKFTNSGSRQWATFIGDMRSYASISFGGNDKIYIAGATNDPNFPVTSNAYQANKASFGSRYDAVIKIFDTTGTCLYSSFFGGNESTSPGIIAADEAGDYYITLWTNATNLPVTRNYAPVIIAPAQPKQGYIAKFSANHSFAWGGYLGRTSSQGIRAVGGKVAVTGNNFLGTLPVTKHSFQTNYGSALYNAFILVFDYAGLLHYGSYYGGDSINSYGNGIDYNPLTGSLYITGNTRDFNFPVSSNAFQTISAGGSEAFLIRLGECVFPVSITADTTVHCYGDSVLLTADSTYDDFLWSTGDTTLSIWADKSGEYWVKVVDSSGCAGYDTVAVNIMSNNHEGVVRGMVASVDTTSGTGGQVKLTWQPDTAFVDSILFYRLYYRHQDSAGYILLMDSIPLADSVFIHSGINTSEKRHYYYLKRFLACGKESDTISIHNPVKFYFDRGQLVHWLNWTRYEGRDIKDYILQEGKGGNWTDVDTIPGTDTAFTKFPAPCNYALTYRIKAVDTAGFFSYSNTATNQALDTIPADAPVITAATMVNDSIVRLDFTGADSMDIFVFDIRRIDSAGNSVSALRIPFTAPGVQYTRYDTLGSIGKKVCYTVVALDSCLNATSSDTFCVILLQGEEGQVKNYLKWHPYKGFSPFNYVLQRDEGSGWADITAPTDTFYTDSAVACNITYDYRVLAISAAGDTSVSNQVILTPFDTLPPAAPVLKSASVQLDQSIKLEWYLSASPDAKFYEIWRDEGSGFNLLTTVEYDSVYEDVSANGHQQTYQYYVIAIDSCNSANRSTPSDTDQTIRVKAQTGACVPLVRMQWDVYTDLPQQTDEYRIWRSEDGAGFQQEYTVTAGIENYTDSSVTENFTYCYRIEAIDNNSGISAFSDTICIIPWVFPEPDTARIVRTTVEKTDDVAGNILVEWEAADAADTFARGYFLYHSTFSAAGPFTLLQDITDLSSQSYVNQNIDTRTANHFYKVVVYNLCSKEGPERETHSPINLEVNNQNLQAELYWTHYKGFPIEQYELKRSENGQLYQTHAVFAPEDSFYIDSTIICGREYAWQVFGYNYSYNLITVSDSVWATAYDSIFPEVAEIRFATVTKTGTTDGEVLVEWNASPSADADYYTLYRREAGAGAWTEAATNITALNHTDQSINTSNTSYEYRLKVTDECENEVFSQIHRTINLTAMPGEEKITLNWNHYGGWPVKEYELYRDGNLYETLPNTETTYTDTLVFCTETYNYKIIAYADSSVALTSESNTDSARSLDTKAPAAVYFRTTSVSNPNDEVYLVWEETTDFDAKNYILYRKLTGDRKWRELAKPALGINTYYDNVQIEDEPICYRVTVEDFCNNESIESNLGCIIIPTGTAEKLHNVIHWTPYEQWTQSVQKYRIYRSHDGSAWQQIGEVNGSTLTYTDNDLGEDDIVDFCYQVEAVELGGPQSESQSKVVCLQQEPIVWVPNAFTPTRSATINDGFEPDGLYIASYQMRIYNRWGGLVYETANSQPWNGKSLHGDYVQEGVYAYEIKVISHTGKTQSFKGTVTLLR